MNNETEYFGSFLSLVNVKYIIVDLTAPYEFPNFANGPARMTGVCPIGSPQSYVALLDEQKDLRVVLNNTNAIIYENIAFTPQITVYEKMFIVENNEFAIPSSAVMNDIYNLTTRNVLFIDKDAIPGNLLNQYLSIATGTVSFNMSSGSKPNMTAYSDEGIVNNYTISQTGPTVFSINPSGKESLYITFGESFDQGWSANFGSQQLKHLSLEPYDTNLFYLNGNGSSSGNQNKNSTIKVFYKFQSIYDFTIIISALTLAVIVSLVIYLSRSFFIRNQKASSHR